MSAPWFMPPFTGSYLAWAKVWSIIVYGHFDTYCEDVSTRDARGGCFHVARNAIIHTDFLLPVGGSSRIGFAVPALIVPY